MSDLKFDQHYSQSFNKDLASVRSSVLEMGALVDQQLHDAIESLANQDTELAEQVVENDHQVNAMEVELDQECTRILALRAPTAADLRLVFSVIKTITDLERIGDEAERVARMILDTDSAGIDPIASSELRHMGDMVRGMLKETLRAFAENDAKLAFDTTRQDLAVDQKYQSITRQVTTFMAEDAANIPWCLLALWVARALERIGDRSCNICEYVIYLVGGKDVRHISPKKMKKAAKAAAK